MTPSIARPDTSPTRLKVSNPGDLLGLIPYLLGFPPQESLVLLLVGEGQVRLTARLDLPPADLSATRAAPLVVQQLSDLADRTAADTLVLLAYSSRPEPARQLLELLAVALEPLGLVDAVYVDETRWWSVMCQGPCCPVEGTPYEVDSHPMAAEAVYAGLSAAGGRADVEARVAGPPARELPSLERVAHAVLVSLEGLSCRQRQTQLSEAVTAFVAAPRRLDDAECAWLALLCDDVTVRDVAWVAMERSEIEGHLDLWSQVVARSVAPWQLAPLCLMGMAAWISGNGALQNCCTERALRLDRSYTLASLLSDLNQHVVPPSRWDSMVVDLRREVLVAAAEETPTHEEVGPLAGWAGGR